MSIGPKIAGKAALALMASVWLLAPAAVLADPPAASDAPVATAKGTPAAPPTTTDADIKSFLAEGADDKNGPLPDNKPHGFVSVGAGTRGYREVAGAVTLPVDGAVVSVAIDDAQIDGRRH